MRMLSGLVQSSIDGTDYVIFFTLWKVCCLSLAYLLEKSYLCGINDYLAQN